MGICGHGGDKPAAEEKSPFNALEEEQTDLDVRRAEQQAENRRNSQTLRIVVTAPNSEPLTVESTAAQTPAGLLRELAPKLGVPARHADPLHLEFSGEPLAPHQSLREAGLCNVLHRPPSSSLR